MANQKISQLEPIGTIDVNQDSFVIVDYSENNLAKRTNLANIGQRVLEANTTDNLTEGSTNLYFTNTRVYTKVKASLIAGSNTSITFDDDLQTITIASQGNVQSVNGETGEVVLDTDNIGEGVTNLYYTDARFDTRLATKTTTNLTEGDNLYYTDGRFDTRLATKTTTNLTEGDNLYYTDTRFDDRLATKTTDNLTEGANLYYTDARVESVLTTESVTKQGNTFNGASQLVQLDGDSKLPAVDGSNLTNLNIPPSTGGDLYLFYNY